jgi:L-lactate dehydrogenase complex protein LldG
VEQFSRELEALGGTCRHCQASELAELVINFLHQRSISHIQAWDAAQLPVGVIDELQRNGIQVEHQHEPNIRVGLTGVDGAIAETGTLVITDAPGRPITASLVPEIHLAILQASQIMAKMPEALMLPGIRQNTAGALISGPSRTADIEMTLTVGMHGPGEVHVYCLTDR